MDLRSGLQVAERPPPPFEVGAATIRQPSRLFKLTGELRNQIYGYYIDALGECSAELDTRPTEPWRSTRFRVLRKADEGEEVHLHFAATCRQARQEFLPLLATAMRLNCSHMNMEDLFGAEACTIMPSALYTGSVREIEVCVREDHFSAEWAKLFHSLELLDVTIFTEFSDVNQMTEIRTADFLQQNTYDRVRSDAKAQFRQRLAGLGGSERAFRVQMHMYFGGYTPGSLARVTRENDGEAPTFGDFVPFTIVLLEVHPQGDEIEEVEFKNNIARDIARDGGFRRMIYH